MSRNQYSSKTAKAAKQPTQDYGDELSAGKIDAFGPLMHLPDLNPLDHIEPTQKASSHRPLDAHKWPHSLAVQVPVIFDGRFRNSVLSVAQTIKFMSKFNNGSRVWVEFGTYISHKGRLALDLNVWVKSQMDEEKFGRYCSKVRDLACQIRDNLRQEAVVVEIDGCLECH